MVADVIFADRGVAAELGDVEPGFPGLDDEGVTNSWPSIVSGRGFAIGFLRPRINVSKDCSLAGSAVRRDFLATEYSVKIDHSCVLEELNCFQVENEQ